MVQTAEGAIAAASEMAQRILTLATQGANTNLSDDQLTAIATEMQSLWTSISNIQTRTKFSGTSLLANATAITVQASNESGDTISISAAGSGTTIGALDNIYAGTLDSSSKAGLLWTAIDDAQSSPATSDMTDVLGAVDDYITALDTQRSTLGAIQNQMEYAVNNITELSANLTAARSRVIDTDYATETASLTKGQILQQAATAMLAQANQMPNVILSLLK